MVPTYRWQTPSITCRLGQSAAEHNHIIPQSNDYHETVADLAARCLRNHVAVRCKPNTAKNYRMSLQHHILPALGTKPLKDVASADVTALHHKLRDTPSAANQATWVLSRMFTLAESWGMIPTGRNPCRHVRYYREQSRERFLTPEEFRRLGAALKKFEAQGSMQPSAVAAIRLLMLTGCRSDEILTLKWDDVDRTTRVLRLRDAKTGPRMVPLTGPVLKVLDGIEGSVAKSGYLVTCLRDLPRGVEA